MNQPRRSLTQKLPEGVRLVTADSVPYMEIDVYEYKGYSRAIGWSMTCWVPALIPLVASIPLLTIEPDKAFWAALLLPIAGLLMWLGAVVYRRKMPEPYRLRISTDAVQLYMGSAIKWSASWVEAEPLLESGLKLTLEDGSDLQFAVLSGAEYLAAAVRVLGARPAVEGKLRRFEGWKAVAAVAALGVGSYGVWMAVSDPLHSAALWIGLMGLVFLSCFGVWLITSVGLEDSNERLIQQGSHEAVAILRILPIMDSEFHVYRYAYPEGMLRRGRLRPFYRSLALAVALAGLVGALLPLLSATREVAFYCFIGGVLWLAMQEHFAWQERRVLADINIKLEVSDRRLFIHQNGKRKEVWVDKHLSRRAVRVTDGERAWILWPHRMSEETGLMQTRRQLMLDPERELDQLG